MKLLELFDRSVPYEWTDFEGFPAATFEVEEVPYLVVMWPYEGMFAQYAKSEIPQQYQTVMGAMIANYKEGDLLSGNYLLGTGNASTVFTTAMNIFEEYIGKYQPEAFSVAALLAEKRHILYARILKRFAKEIAKTGYALVDEETMQNTPFGAMHAFYLLRQDLT